MQPVGDFRYRGGSTALDEGVHIQCRVESKSLEQLDGRILGEDAVKAREGPDGYRVVVDRRNRGTYGGDHANQHVDNDARDLSLRHGV